MLDLLPMFFIVLGALALVITLFWLWQSLRETALDDGALLTQAGPGGSRPSAPAVSSERAKLLAEKQALLLALKDLNGERDAGKLSDDDYAEFNTRYRARARDVLQALDAQIAPYREQARKLIAGALAEVPTAQPATVASTESACASCGVKNDSDAVFCKKCGARIASVARSEEESRA